MKVSLNLAQEFSNVDLKSLPHDDLLKRVGAQLGAVEEITDWAPKLDGAVIVKVISCEKHPDADKLSVCQVDDGSGQATQVVCGAPNVRADMFAVWLKPGVTVPSTRDKDPFILEAREIRGVVSNGMLASPKELGISENHDGILEVDAEEVGREPKPGEPLTGYFGLDDFVIDCENKMFTHRPDCFGNLGVARELAGINGLKFQSPDWYLHAPTFVAMTDLPFIASNQVPELVSRFMAVVMQNVSVGTSPVWLQAVLARVGIKSINNIVDATNYIMHLTGQPLHAFDYDKIKERSTAPGIFPRMSQKGEKLLLLGQKEIELSGEEIVIATDKQAVALAGVIGGAETEVDENTKNIIIECATFDMYSVRRTSMRFGLFTDAVTRYNKGQSPLQNDRVLAFAISKINELSGGSQASDVADLQQNVNPKSAVSVSTESINIRLGSELSAEEMAQLLQNVEFAVEVKDNTLVITPPFWRMDVEQPEDIVEEIGRLYGYDKLPVTLPGRSAKPTSKNQMFEFKQQLRQSLKERGANEVLTYSFVHGDLLRKTGTDPDKWAYHIRNAISPDLQYYRTSLIPSLLAKVHANIKAQAGDDTNQFALFEVGKAHVKGEVEDGLPNQMERVGFVFAADEKTVKTRLGGPAYYVAKKYVEALTNDQAVVADVESYDYPVTSAYQPGRSAVIILGDEIIGVIGEFKPEVRMALKLPESTAGFEIDLESLSRNIIPKAYEPLPSFPATSQDITLDSSGTYGETKKNLESKLAEISGQHGYIWQIKPKDLFQPESNNTKYTFSITLGHDNRTLTTEETNKLMQSLQSSESHDTIPLQGK